MFFVKYSAFISNLRKIQGVVGPDFSLYGDYPLPIQLYNTYRSRIITHWLKFNNIKVIPNIRWSTKHSYSFCFDGLKKGDVVFVGSHGCSKRKGDKKTFDAGFREMVNRLNPSTICVYGKTNRPIFGEYRELGINIIGFQSEFSSVHKRS
ncbi:MAG: DUF4417 domain-containing protein [Erysipelotrichaceae bacterium]|nr:DUF4417 domain-containing protein [Erysipelotrichaceae bacterium]